MASPHPGQVQNGLQTQRYGGRKDSRYDPSSFDRRVEDRRDQSPYEDRSTTSANSHNGALNSSYYRQDAPSVAVNGNPGFGGVIKEKMVRPKGRPRGESDLGRPSTKLDTTVNGANGYGFPTVHESGGFTPVGPPYKNPLETVKRFSTDNCASDHLGVLYLKPSLDFSYRSPSSSPPSPTLRFLRPSDSPISILALHSKLRRRTTPHPLSAVHIPFRLVHLLQGHCFWLEFWARSHSPKESLIDGKLS